ncbi:MAG TPA: ABC transporter permease subunit/CPBP intramembrane protease [Candidatus Cloacimonadota bacterium]|nr:ABC transporter permease subunit/CPBP intramembrane protease [Candidatus Cloacimonadota bacterium]HOH78483.1 ABC transporter permease subunit/CPBP intramembrane protease [Candidatus Cloacimonadota bacterium]
MSFNKALIVYRKELLEMMRDRRTLFATFIIPLILYPLLFIGFGSIMSRQTAVLEERGAEIAFADSVNNHISAAIIAGIKTNKGYNLLPYNQDTQGLYNSGNIQAIVSIGDSITAAGSSVYKVLVSYDSSKERNQLIYRKIKDSVTETKESSIATELSKRDVDPALMELIRVDAIDTSSAQKRLGSYLGMILPYIMIMMLVAGAATVAGDLVAGEKERRTLETLLVSSAQRNELVLGKYLTVITVAMVNVVVNLFSMGFSMQFLVGSQGIASSMTQMPVVGFLILLAAMLPLATLFAALLMSISTFSRNLKEAASYQQPVMMISMLLGMISFIPSVEINNLLALVPVVNIALLFKAVLINEYQLSHLLITVGSTLLLDIGAIWLTVKLFSTEAMLFRTDEDSSLKNVRKEKRNLFNPFNGMVFFALALVVMYYLGSYFQREDMMKGLVQTQILIILLPPLIILNIFKLKPKEILRITLPKPRELAIVPFIAVSGAVLVTLLMNVVDAIYPFPDQYTEQLMGLFKMSDNLWVLLGIVALAPGICEEIMFRGFLMRFFEGNSKKMAVVISALLFGVFHLDPFRLIPTFLLGLILGYLTIRSGSIINSMLYHTLNNSVAVLVTTYASSAWMKPLLRGSEGLQWWLAAPAALILAGSLWLFHKVTTPKGA